MTHRSDFLRSLSSLKEFLKADVAEVDSAVQRGYNANTWFIPEFSNRALNAIVAEFLVQEKVARWMDLYPADQVPKKIAIIMAGNLPLVGFHDLFCVLAAGHKAIIKCSDKDAVMMPWLIEQWIRVAPELHSSIEFSERLVNFDAAIATGSNNSARYFEYYFRAYPHILRKNRNGIAVLTGEESLEDLKALSDDIFLYFGMGCRNVSKIYVPEGYDFTLLKEALSSWNYLSDHNKFRHNLDYNFAIYIINNVSHIHLGHLILKEDQDIASRIGCLHYGYYTEAAWLEQELNGRREEIQCVVSGSPVHGWEHIRFGESQQPRLDQFADGIDIMRFLTSI